MSAVLWILLGIVWISDGLPARGGDISGWLETEEKTRLALEKRKTDGDGRTQEGDTNFDVAVETPTKEETFPCEVPGSSEPLQTRDISDESPVYVECSPVREERRGEVVYSCKRHGLGKRGTFLVVRPSGSVTDGQYVLPYNRVIEKRSAQEESVYDLQSADASEVGASGSPQVLGNPVNVSERAPSAYSDASSGAQADRSQSVSAEKMSNASVDPSKIIPAEPSSVVSADRSPAAPAVLSPVASHGRSPVSQADQSPVSQSDRSPIAPVDRTQIAQADLSPASQDNRSPIAPADRSKLAPADGSQIAQAEQFQLIPANQSQPVPADLTQVVSGDRSPSVPAERSPFAPADRSSSAKADSLRNAPGDRSPIAQANFPVIGPAERFPRVIEQAETSDSTVNQSLIGNVSFERPSIAVASGTWAKMEAEHKAINSQGPLSHLGNLQEIKSKVLNGNVSINFGKDVRKENDSSKATKVGVSKEVINEVENKNGIDLTNPLGRERIDNSQDMKSAELSFNGVKTNRDLKSPASLIQLNNNKMKNSENNINMHENFIAANEITPNYNENTNKVKNMEGMLNAGVKSRDGFIMEPNSSDIKMKSIGLKNHKEVNVQEDNEISSNLNDLKNIEGTGTDSNKHKNSQQVNALDTNSSDLKYMEIKVNNPSNIDKVLVSGQPIGIESNINRVNAMEDKLSRATFTNQDNNSHENAVQQEKSANISENNKMEINLNSVIVNRETSNTKTTNGKSNLDNNSIESKNHLEKTQSDLNSIDGRNIERNSVIEEKKEINKQSEMVSKTSNSANSVENNSNLASNHGATLNIVSNVIETKPNVESRNDGLSGPQKDSVNNLSENNVPTGLGSSKLKATVPLARLEGMEYSDSKILIQAGLKNHLKSNGEALNEHNPSRISTEGFHNFNNQDEKFSKPIGVQDTLISKNVGGNALQNLKTAVNEKINNNGTSNVLNSDGKVAKFNDVQVFEVDSSKISLRDTAGNKASLNEISDGNIRETNLANLKENDSLLSIESVPYSINRVETEKKSNDFDKTFVLNVDPKDLARFQRQSDIKKAMIESSNLRREGRGVSNKGRKKTQSERTKQIEEDVFALPLVAKDLQDNVADIFQRNLPAPSVRNFSDTCVSDSLPGLPWCPNTPLNTECPLKGCVTRCQDNVNTKWQGPGSRRKRQKEFRRPAVQQKPKKRQICTTACPTSPPTCSTTHRCPTTTSPTCRTTPTTCSTTTCRTTTVPCKTPAICPTANPCPNTCSSSTPCPTTCPPVTCPTVCGPPLDPPGEVPPCFRPPPPHPCCPVRTTTCPRLQRRAVRGRHSSKKKKKMALRQAGARGIRPQEYQTVYS